MADRDKNFRAMSAHVAAIVPLGRVKTIHKKPCPPCPSMQGSDPETDDIKTWPREQQLGTVFRCGWRGTHACKGYCDEFDILESELKSHVEKTESEA